MSLEVLVGVVGIIVFTLVFAAGVLILTDYDERENER